MAVKNYKPTSPARRQKTVTDYSVLSKKKPEKSLLKVIKKNSGRNNSGRITVRHRGGGNKRKMRVIDWKRRKDGVPAKVVSIEYDPSRTSFVALLQYIDGEKNYILQPAGLKVGDKVVSGDKADIRVGNAKKLKDIPVGTIVHNLEMKPGYGAQVVRTAGAEAQLVAKEGKYATIKLPSGEMRLFLQECRATIGSVGNADHENISIGKAGVNRHKGIRPSVRGVVMNPNDHPHGGGEGKAPVGMPSPLTPWGQKTLGFKTRRKNNPSNRYIVRRRKK